MSSNTNIGNTPVNQGYVQLIHMGETGGIDGTLRALYDGDGTASDLLIASDKVKISTELFIGSKTLTEFVQDTVGAMLTTGSYTNITTTYDDTNGNIDLNASGDVTLSNSVTLSNKTLAAPILTGTTQGASITLSGDLTVNGTTTTVNQTNLDVSDNIIGLNRGAGSNANDSGIIIERGSTGNNAAIIWDESADKFTLGTTTSTPSATGNLTISTGTLVANIEGAVTGNVTGSASLNLLKSSNLSDLASASTARSNLGVDAAGTDNSTNVTLAGSLDYITLSGQQITRNAINLTTDVSGTLPVGNGGTGLTSISTLLNSNVTPTSLGLVIGTNVQAYDAGLQSISGLTTATNKMIYTTGSDTYAVTTLSATGRSLIDDNTTADMLTTLGLTATAAELNYTDGVTSNIQTQLGTKAPTTRSITPVSQRGISGGGDLSADRTIELSQSQLATVTLDAADNLILFDNSDSDIPKRFVAQDIFDSLGGITIDGTTANGVLTYGGTNNIDTESSLTFNGSVLELKATSAGRSIEVGSGATGDITSFVDLIGDTTYSDYGARFIRFGGANATTDFRHRGTGDFRLIAQDSAAISLQTGSTERLRILSGGNVGIGVTSPSYTLDVSGDINLTGSLRKGGLAMISIDSSYTTILKPSGAVGIYLGQSDASNYYDNTKHRFRPSGGGSNYYMTISTGGLGISRGTDDAEAKLHIGDSDNDNNALASNVLGTTSGDSIDYIKLECDSTNANQLIFSSERVADGSTWTTTRERITRRVDTSEMGYIQFGSSFAASTADMISFGEVGVGDYMGITGDGKVGIGTNSPTEKLEISGGKLLVSGGQIRSGSYLEGFPSFSFANDNDTGMFSDTANQLEFSTGGSSRLTINSSGNVGIGTTTPDERLSVVSGSSSRTAHFGRYEDNGLFLHSEAAADDTHKNWIIQTQENIDGGLEITPSASNGGYDWVSAGGLAIKHTGFVGIGTNSPDSKLQVEYTTTSNGSAAIAEFGTSGSGAIANSGHQVIIGGPSVSGYTGLLIHSDSTSGYGQISFADGRGANDSWRGVIVYKHSDEYMGFWTNATEKMRIVSGGDAHFDQDVIAYSSTPSDIRLKENFTKIDNGLDVVNKLDGHTFNWKKSGDRLSAGFKAQEVEKILPHLVDEKKLPLHSDDDKEYKILRYEEMIPYLVEAIKEQQVQIDELKTQIGVQNG